MTRQFEFSLIQINNFFNWNAGLISLNFKMIFLGNEKAIEISKWRHFPRGQKNRKPFSAI